MERSGGIGSSELVMRFYNLKEINMQHKEFKLVIVDPQPTYIENSGRWHWPLPEKARHEVCCTSVCSASREWWEYAPSEAKPHPFAEGVRLRVWYWCVPVVCSSITQR